MSEKTTLPPALSRSATLRATSFNEADNTIEVVWTTGAAVRRRDWRTDEFYDEVLEVTPQAVRLDRLNAGAPFLAAHDDVNLAAVIGAVVPGSARIEGGKGYARVALSSAPVDTDIVQKIKDGVVRHVSVGYAVHGVKIETRDVGTDVWRVVDWEPYEISAVPIPADAGAHVRAADPTSAPIEFIADAPAREKCTAADSFDGLTSEDLAALALAAKYAFDGEGTPETRADAAYRAATRAGRDHDDASVVYGAALAWALHRGGQIVQLPDVEADADSDAADSVWSRGAGSLFRPR